MHVKLLKHIPLVVNHFAKVTSSNYLNKHLCLEEISWCGSDFFFVRFVQINLDSELMNSVYQDLG